MKNFTKHASDLLPGFFVCLVTAALSQVISSYVPAVGSALFAIGIGILCGNTFLNKDIFNTGTKFSESRLLEYSIVLTGLTLQLSDIAGVGLSGILFIALQMGITIFVTYLIGRRLKFGKKFCLLMSAGNAVCGSSAIGTVSPVLEADSKDKGISITIVNVTGTVLMVLLPLVAAALYQEETVRTSGLIGGVLQSIGQVIASAKFVNEEVVQMATIFKIIRIVFLVAVAYVFSQMDTDEEKALFTAGRKAAPAKSAAAKTGVPTQAAVPVRPAASIFPALSAPQDEAGRKGAHKKLSCGIPWFIIGFFLFSIITTTGLIPSPISHAAKMISSQFEIIALAAIGMRVKFRDLVKEGPKALLYGGCVGVMQTVLAVVLIRLTLG